MTVRGHRREDPKAGDVHETTTRKLLCGFVEKSREHVHRLWDRDPCFTSGPRETPTERLALHITFEAT